MPTAPTIDLTTSGTTATLRIDHPQRKNAMTAHMWGLLPRLLEPLAKDPSVRVVVLTGAGTDFCAGADISELTAGADGTAGGGAVDVDAAGARVLDDRLAEAAGEALAAFPKPTIAMVDGLCVGGGCLLATACDLRVGTPRTRVGVPAAKLGVVYPASSLRRIVALAGPSTAKRLLFTADLLGAEEALRTGLLDEVVPESELAHHVTGLAATVGDRSQVSVRAAKSLVDAIGAGGLTPDLARSWDEEAVRSGDLHEGITAFLERRPARFAAPPS
ncbi:enoyl-CoA hydratase/isomerase family protein [Nocardiopsis aegyptia]|uniref:Enoyl-CoA hydratase/carnithine racemase n=1 Tax=Nocardiopsis aegyptia TaxID=220378 RepID=A0A7Z0JBH5_9ACTN|nr:enoyl-CoA hydratase-related protein [Nocardiopsis aegyptia]NYJ35460.1 enoyl-CoA hydratase/carnithine racemase [Nocardiopsis aegyptia]